VELALPVLLCDPHLILKIVLSCLHRVEKLALASFFAQFEKVLTESLLSSEYDNKETFLHSSGPDSLLAILKEHSGHPLLVARSSEVVAVASTKHEGNKVQFMEGKAEEMLIEVLKKHVQDPAVVTGSAAALQAFATADDFKALSAKVCDKAP
jgi:hypothetical protein